MLDPKYSEYLTTGDDGLFEIVSKTPKKIIKELEEYDADYYKMYGEHLIKIEPEEEDEE